MNSNDSGRRHWMRATRATMRFRIATAAVALAWAGCATAAPTCTSASGAELAFGAIQALAATGDRSSNSGTSFWVNCNNEVLAAPTLYSATQRTLVSGSGSLPFSLSLAAPGGLELPSAAPGQALAVVNDGTNRTVTIHGLIRAVDFRALPAGTYSRIVALTVAY